MLTDSNMYLRFIKLAKFLPKIICDSILLLFNYFLHILHCMTRHCVYSFIFQHLLWHVLCPTLAQINKFLQLFERIDGYKKVFAQTVAIHQICLTVSTVSDVLTFHPFIRIKYYKLRYIVQDGLMFQRDPNCIVKLEGG